MTDFIQLHMLTSYPPSNLNRDDLGRPKTARMGGADRLRISSQSLKRAWRTSDLFESALAGHIGTRTKLIGVEANKALIEKGIAGKKADDWAKQIARQFGKLKTTKVDNKTVELLEIEQLAHICPEEQKSISTLIETLATEKRAPEKEELNLLRQKHNAVDIAMFGRMLASQPAYNMEAAVQVSHAVTIHPVTVEDDYFTAVDDLNKGDEDAGAAHIGEAAFAAGVFYQYVCINRNLLLENLSSNQELSDNALVALVESALKVSPSGKQNSFASRAYASYLLAEKGPQQPRSLSVAFLKPVFGNDILVKGIELLEGYRNKMETAYGKCADSHKVMDVLNGKGSLDEILAFIRE